jgi:hypothetical protein
MYDVGILACLGSLKELISDFVFPNLSKSFPVWPKVFFVANAFIAQVCM